LQSNERYLNVGGCGLPEGRVWEQKKLEAGKMPENAAESPASGARFVRRFFVEQTR